VLRISRAEIPVIMNHKVMIPLLCRTSCKALIFFGLHSG
jgi:hypothetical protein